MILIKSWLGRTGNNILQIIRSIHYAILHNHNTIIFKSHSLLTSKVITLKEIENKKSNINYY